MSRKQYVKNQQIIDKYNKQSILISIIIPTHNVEKYILHCLKSIIDQSYSNFEIIIVDDFSTDGTLTIVSEVANICNKIEIIQLLENKGSAFAREKGLEICRGELITFVDGDDCYCDNTALEKIIQTYICHPVDCVMWEYQAHHIGNITRRHHYKGKTGYYNVQDVAFMKTKSPLPHWHYLWNKCYRHDVLKKNGIHFIGELRKAEDVRFNEDFMRVAQDYYIIPQILYEYNCTNPNQVTKESVKLTLEVAQQSLNRYKETLDNNLQICSDLKILEKAQKYVYRDFYKKTIRLLLFSRRFGWFKSFREFVFSDNMYKCSIDMTHGKQWIIIGIYLEIVKSSLKRKIKKFLAFF